MAGAAPLGVGAVVIDLDGTLLDTVADLSASANLMLAGLGLPQVDAAAVRTFVGKGIANLVRRCLAAALAREPEAALIERALPLYESCYEQVNGMHTTIYPGVVEGLDALRAKALPLGCITNKSQRFTVPLLRQVALDGYFALTLSGDSLPRKKPDPLPLAHAARHFGVAPARLLMIGDSVNDAQAARAAGCPVFCVDYGYNEGGDVRSLDIDAIVPSIAAAAERVVKV